MNNANNNITTFIAIIIAGIMISGAIIYTGNQKNTTPNTNTLEDKLISVATEQGLNKKKFKTCLTKRDDSKIKKDIEYAQSVGVQGTPAFFIGRTTKEGVIKGKLLGGMYPFDSFKKIIEEALKGELKEGKLVTVDSIPNPTVKDLGMTQSDYDKLSDEDKSEISKKYKEYFADKANKSAKLTEVSIGDNPVIGKDDAPVTIIDFSDFECPFCKQHAENTLPKLIKEYVDTGKVKIVFRDMIAVPSHNPVATTEAIAANCAKGQGSNEAYLKMHGYIYKNTKSNGMGL